MKTLIIMSVIALFTTTNSKAQLADEKAIKETIIGFSKAGDQNDSNTLASFLDDNYRIVMNRLFGSKEVGIMSRDVYLEKIKTKEYGGDNRKVKIEAIMLNGTTAAAKVSLIGSKMTFVSLFSLVKDSDGKWKLVEDMPLVK